MPTYNDQKFLSLPQQVQKNKEDILSIQSDIEAVAVGPQGATGPRGAQGIQGIQGIQGEDGAPASSLEITATEIGALDFRININYATTPLFNRFILEKNYLSSGFLYATLLVDGVDSGHISILDFILIHCDASETYKRLFFYNEDGEATEYIGGTTETIQIQFGTTFKLISYNSGVFTGAQGEQGIQGIQGEQNLALDDTYEDGDSFPEYTSQIMIQIIGGDYDGMTFIKESLEEDDVVKFGPYAQLITITDPGTGVQCNLLNGVTSFKVYTMENLT